MSMVTPPPDATDRSTTHRVETVRSGDGPIGCAAPLPEELLPSGGTDHAVAGRLYAMRWLELATPTPIPVTWSDLLDGPLD